MQTLFEMSHLLDFYGGLLTEKQRTIAQYTYHQDLSLTEISQIMGITKQAVSDTLQRARQALLRYEQVLGLRARFYTVEMTLEDAAKDLQALHEKVNDPSLQQSLEAIEERLLALSLDEDMTEGEEI